MKNNLSEKNDTDIFSLDNKKFSKVEYKDEDDDSKAFSYSSLILFLILIIVIIILIIIITLSLVYKIIIKKDLQKSKRNKHREKLLSFNERKKVDKYINDCFNGILYDKNKYEKAENPKISVIIPIYNKEKFILRILRSIQNQSLKDIEIIFCDDASYDNSTKIIEELKKEDERIILMRHYINKGTLVNRIDGANIAKGEYLLFIDGDDILLNNILEKAYLKAKENNTDIIQFKAYSGDFNNTFYRSDITRTNQPIYQPELSSLMYYEKGELHQTEYFIWGKLIKRETFLETIKSIDKYYLNQNMSLHEDGLILFMLFKKAKTYLFINDYGLFYYYNELSTLNNLRNKNRINKSTKECFLYLEYMFNYTNDTLYEKNMAVYQFKWLLKEYNDIYLKTTQGFDYVYKIIDLYINCKIISEEDKTIFINLKTQFKKTQQNLSHVK